MSKLVFAVAFCAFSCLAADDPAAVKVETSLSTTFGVGDGKAKKMTIYFDNAKRIPDGIVFTKRSGEKRILTEAQLHKYATAVEKKIGEIAKELSEKYNTGREIAHFVPQEFHFVTELDNPYVFESGSGKVFYTEHAGDLDRTTAKGSALRHEILHSLGIKH